jgi:hypothetical protein
VKLGTTFKTDLRLTKNIPLPREQRLTFNFEIFNAFNYSTITSAYNTALYAYADGTLAPYDTSGGSKILATPGAGYASAGFPDGTNARREQVSVRYTF